MAGHVEGGTPWKLRFLRARIRCLVGADETHGRLLTAGKKGTRKGRKREVRKGRNELGKEVYAGAWSSGFFCR
jgi:hypothetical protein